MAGCEFSGVCPRLAGGDLEFLKGIWVYWYCNGSKHPICAVKRLLAVGEPVPPELAPNGDAISFN